MGTCIVLATFAQSCQKRSVAYTLTRSSELADNIQSLSWLQVFFGRFKQNVHKVVFGNLAVLLEVSVSHIVLEYVFKSSDFVEGV